MKSKKINIGLKFNKETVANLNDRDMSMVRGGLTPTIDVTNCASNCVCGSLAEICITVKCY